MEPYFWGIIVKTVLYLVSGILRTKVDHVLNLGGHPASDVTSVAASDDVTKTFVVLQVDFRNDFSVLKNILKIFWQKI